MTTRPEHSTCPKWAARLAREQALEEAAALCEAHGSAVMLCTGDGDDYAPFEYMAKYIRALKTKDPS